MSRQIDLVDLGCVVRKFHDRGQDLLVLAVGGDDAADGLSHVIRPAGSALLPQLLNGVGDLGEHLLGEVLQELGLVLEIDVEGGPRGAGGDGEPLDAEFGERGAVAHQGLGGLEQTTSQLIATLLPQGG